MKRHLLFLALAGFSLVGCVPVEKYRASKMEAESLQEQLSKAQGDVLAAQQKADALQKNQDMLNANSGNAMSLVNNLQQQLTARNAAYDDLNKRYAEAIPAYTTALERIGTPQERHWPLLYARAMCYEKTGQWPQAEADLQAALKLRPEEPSLLNFLGYSWIDRGEHLDKARAMVERAVELRPRDGYIVDSLGWALYRLGDYEAAVAKLERAVELKPVDPTINDHLGDAYWRAGRRVEARFQWMRALRSADDDTDKAAIQSKLDKGLQEQKAAAKQ